jgi:hypothetical protein
LIIGLDRLHKVLPQNENVPGQSQNDSRAHMSRQKAANKTTTRVRALWVLDKQEIRERKCENCFASRDVRGPMTSFILSKSKHDPTKSDPQL